ncbi:uncharacterized protein LOC119684274 [Teleopsis dalmanni]|uniref:uncharacterized protein LOC119684274 n=1 Tax=Teleopsis dalmanni TaxID=139649 RepID=UPI0018CFDB94|nr:uncharacterized protein LOC119684274 [Teleopsis dalmanni]
MTQCLINYLYNQIPPINAIDDYDDCLYQNTQNTSGTFCFIYAEIKPNASSEIWRTIEEHSRTERNRFRYDKLLRGVCLAKCMDSPKEESHVDISTNEPIEDKELLNFFRQIYGYQIYENIGYDSVIHTCLNREMHKNYNLRLRTNLLYCEHSKSNTTNRYDYLDILGYTLISSIGIFVIFSSVYDHFLFKNQTSEKWFHFYRKPFKSKASTLLTSFSIMRNYAIFMKPLGGRTAHDLQCFNFFRLIGEITIIIAHIVLNIMTVVGNPKFVEENIFNGLHAILGNEITAIHTIETKLLFSTYTLHFIRISVDSFLAS